MADTSPDTNRLASPSTSPIGGGPNAWASPRSSTSANRPSPIPKVKPSGHTRQQNNNYFGGDSAADSSYTPIGDSYQYNIPQANADVERGGISRGREALNDFETSLPLRLDYEACLAYLLLPPVGGVLLLIGEWKSDYVRYVVCFVMVWGRKSMFGGGWVLVCDDVWVAYGGAGWQESTVEDNGALFTGSIAQRSDIGH